MRVSIITFLQEKSRPYIKSTLHESRANKLLNGAHSGGTFLIGLNNIQT